MTKYLTKSIADTYGDAENMSDARAAHLDRLAAEVRWLPCTPRCAIWLRYGGQPKGATAGMVPGYCPAKAHDREHLGLGGRRVLVPDGGPARPSPNTAPTAPPSSAPS